jgi:hypothetical protein
MDTSETYIKMCDCPEIQGLRKSLNGDFVYDLVSEKIIVKSEFQGSPINSTWLPRQDQLQEMASLKHFFIDFIFSEKNIAMTTETLVELGKNDTIQQFYQATSMEQLWLAFVMKEKFNKTWSGTEWR